MKWAWVILLLVFAACTNNNKIPDGIIPKRKMEDILWDMIRTDRFANQFLVQDSVKRKQKTFELYENVFHIHHISREDFLKSYKFYLGRPDITKVMFDSISVRAERKRSEVYRIPSKDSLTREHDSTMRVVRARMQRDAIKRGDSLLRSPKTPARVRDSIGRARDTLHRRPNKPLPSRLDSLRRSKMKNEKLEIKNQNRKPS